MSRADPLATADAAPSVRARIALLQLASPALPIGGYSYSSGLEWAIESGQVQEEDSAREWIADALALLLARFDVPLMGAALALLHKEGLAEDGVSDETLEQLVALNAEAIASRETRELRQESAQMGYSLGRWLAAVVPDARGDARVADQLAPLSLPLAWALAAHRLGLDGASAALAMLWSFVENQIMVLMKALPMGQIVAQRLLHSLAPAIESALDTALALPHADWSSAAPLLAVASSHHETQYSRLFRS